MSDYGSQLPSLLASSGQDGAVARFSATFRLLKSHGQPLVTRSVKVRIRYEII